MDAVPRAVSPQKLTGDHTGNLRNQLRLRDIFRKILNRLLGDSLRRCPEFFEWKGVFV